MWRSSLAGWRRQHFIPRARRSASSRLGVSAFAAGGTVGLAIGPPAVVLLTANGGLGAAPWLMLPGLVLAVVLRRVLPAAPRPRRENAAAHPRLLRGQVAVLTAVAALAALASVTFVAAMPLWLTQHHGLDEHHALIGWTLAIFSIACASGGVVGSWLASRIDVRILVPAALVLSALPLGLALAAKPETVPFFAFVIAGGTLLNAPMPVLVVAAQQAAPHTPSSASGMVMGFASGVAGVMYFAVGALAEATTLSAGMVVGCLAVVPAAAVALLAICPTSTSLNRRLALGVPATCGCAATPADHVHDDAPLLPGQDALPALAVIRA